MRKLWVGIDPGDRWCGFASLYYFKHEWRAEAGTFDATNYTLDKLVDRLMQDAYRCRVVCEDFQARRAFTSLATPRLIGALQYAALKRDCHFDTVRTGDPDTELEMMGLNAGIAKWQQHWPFSSNDQWAHARSAWRVLMQWLLQHRTTVFQLVREAEKFRVVPNSSRREPGDLLAPTMVWRAPMKVHQLRLL